MDKITLDRIGYLHPKIRAKVLEAYKYANAQILGKGVRLRFAYTLRTNQEQDALYAQGRTKLFDDTGKRLGIVTNAKGGQSIHNYGLAFDIVLLLDKNNDGIFETASWDTKADNDKNGVSDWMAVVKYFKSLGFAWGGDWSNPYDPPHFQMDFGYNWRTLLTKTTMGETFTEVINGKKYTWVNI